MKGGHFSACGFHSQLWFRQHHPSPRLRLCSKLQ